jgi:hypothetical protein
MIILKGVFMNLEWKWNAMIINYSDDDADNHICTKS